MIKKNSEFEVTINNNNIQKRIKLIENFFNKEQKIDNKNIRNIIDEKNDSFNSDKETEQEIANIRKEENDEEDDIEDKIFEEKRNKARSKKIVNKKIINNECKEEFPQFSAECKFYGEGKERYHVKILIDSSFSLIFFPEMKKNFKLYNANYYQFPLLSIKNYITTKKNKKYVIDIVLKDYRSFSFKLLQEDYLKFNEVIQEYAMPNDTTKYFRYAYYYHNKYGKKKNNNIQFIDGWNIYNEEKEFKFQGLDFEEEFRIINNKNFDFCSSYPKQIVVPKSMTDDDIKKCAQYRTKERFPALTYRYKKNGKCIWRSSQTKNTIKGKTNKDVILLTKIAKNSKKLYVYDARPLLNAWANKLKGAGYEDTSQYSDINMELIFCNIPNIHVVRKSCHKLYSTICYNKNDIEDNSKVKSNIESGNWYDCIALIIKGAIQISETIKNGNTVLIHCSDGWDRTTQLCSTAQLLLEKRFRTLNGFICLIEKDWLSFGHQFRFRNGMYYSGECTSNENQKSPIFLQWLDTIYQIMIQNYDKFEFNTELLFFLANEIYTGTYGTFLFNNEQEREKYNAKTKTESIWSYVIENEDKFINQIYEPLDNSPFKMNYKLIQLWNKYFFRFEEGSTNYDDKFNKAFREMNNKINKDKKIIDELVKFINEKCSGVDINSLNDDCKNLLQEKSNL